MFYPVLKDRPINFRLNQASPLYRGLIFAGVGQHPGATLYQDGSASKNHGTLNGYTGTGNTPAQRWSAAIGRRALSFYGVRYNSGDYVEAGGVGNLSAASVCMWAKLDNTSTYQALFSGGGGDSNSAWSIAVNYPSAGDVALRNPFKGTQATFSGIMPAGSWHHICFTVAATTATTAYLVFDGVPLGSGTTSYGISPSMDNIRIGNDRGGDYLQAAVADVCVWSRVLALYEISALADPSNVDLRVGGVPLILPMIRFWPVASVGFRSAWAQQVNQLAG